MSNTGGLTIELPSQRAQAAFNLRRWAELLGDTELAKIEGRVETDRHGHIIMSPPPAPIHGRLQIKIGSLLERCMRAGSAISECAISTADGVKAADVAWASLERIQELGDSVCFRRAPEICVEILSPGNTNAEIREKTALYFDAGAQEVWHCSIAGAMMFLAAGKTQPLSVSQLCPEFPTEVQLR
jgi:Uma2 family endonuclease